MKNIIQGYIYRHEMGKINYTKENRNYIHSFFLFIELKLANLMKL